MINNSEDKTQYNKYKNKSVFSIRFSPVEKSLLESMMSQEGWESMSGYIKNKLFGEDPDYKLQKRIETKDPGTIAITLKDNVLELVNQYDYVLYRYNKDMQQLYREEGVDVKKWISSTNRWHSTLAKETQSMLRLIRMIADELGLKEYFDLPSDHMPEIVYGKSSQEEMDAMAEQLRKEAIMMGRITD